MSSNVKEQFAASARHAEINSLIAFLFCDVGSGFVPFGLATQVATEDQNSDRGQDTERDADHREHVISDT